MENNIDKLFQKKVGGMDVPPFDAGAWQAMESLIEEEGLVPEEDKPRKGLLYFLLGGVICTLLTLLIVLPSQEASTFQTDTVTSSKTTEATVIEASQSTSSINQREEFNQIALSNEQRNEPTNVTKREQENNVVENEDLIKANTTHAVNDKKYHSEKSQNNVRNTDSNIAAEKQVESNSSTIGSTATHNEIAESKSNNIAISTLPIDNSKWNSGEKESSESKNFDVNTSVVSANDGENINDRVIFDSPYYLPSLQTVLSSDDEKPITPEVRLARKPLFNIAISTEARQSNGFGYSIGPELMYRLGSSATVSGGVIFNQQSFDTYDELHADEIQYSFGSTKRSKTFSPKKIVSVALPIGYSRQMTSSFGLESRAVLHYTLGVYGEVKSVDTETNEQSISMAWVSSPDIKSLSTSFYGGATYKINRYYSLRGGLTYTTSILNNGVVSSASHSNWYPTLGMNYSLFKF